MSCHVEIMNRCKMFDETESTVFDNEQTLRGIFENATEGIFQVAFSGRFVSANPSLAHLFGYSSPAELRESILEMREQMFVDPVRYDELVRLLREHDAVPNFEALMRRKSGELFWASMNVRIVRDELKNPAFFEGTMRDITKRKEAEEALAESEERYRTVIEHSNDGIAIVHDGLHLFVNRKFVEMFGFKEVDEVIGTPVIRTVHPEDREKVREINSSRMKGLPVPTRYEFKGIRNDGEMMYLEASAAETIYRNLPVTLVFLRDVTERKQAEEVFIQSHRQLEQLNSAKTKAVNHISHELKTPLSVIQGSVRILRGRLKDSQLEDQVESMLQAMEKNLLRLFQMQKEADAIVRATREVDSVTLLDDIGRLKQRLSDLGELSPEVSACCDGIQQWVSRRMPGMETFSPIELHSFLLNASKKALRLAAGRRVGVRVEGKEDIHVLMDVAVLSDMIEGLIRNAIENTPDGGMVTLSVEEREDILVLVSDTGVGITEDDQQYIFDGLFHAKDTERYTSKQAYSFGAGGKGLDLLRMKVYAQRFAFGLSLQSRRCGYLRDEGVECPGDIALCPHCTTTGDCYLSGSTFTLSFSKDSTERHRPASPPSPAVTLP
jgi:PAS domain S-box-containing protein